MNLGRASALALGARITRVRCSNRGRSRAGATTEHGQLGDGATTPRATPVTIQRLSGVVALAAGARHTCALATDGSVQCWGYNATGQLGDGTTEFRSVPVPVHGLRQVVAIAAGSDHTCARLHDGSVRCWGADAFGQVGDGAHLDAVVVPQIVDGVRDVVELALGQDVTCARSRNGITRCWGGNSAGQLGDATTLARSVPAPVVDLTQRTRHLGLRCDTRLWPDDTAGTLRCWGGNRMGQLGDGSFVDQLRPAQGSPRDEDSWPGAERFFSWFSGASAPEDGVEPRSVRNRPPNLSRRPGLAHAFHSRAPPCPGDP